MEREHGRIVSVSTRTLGSPLDADAVAGATELVVFDSGEFDEDGGTLSINGATLAYASVDDDAATITLTDPLPAAALDGDFVACWDTLYDTAGTEKTAMVQLDGDDDNPDPIEATVPHFLADKLADGDRGGPGETVVIGYGEEDDEWRILDVLGLSDASGAGEKHCNTDTYTLAAAGDQTFKLSHTPEDGSLAVHWHPDGKGGVHLLPSEWTLNGSTLTVPDPGYFAASDKIATEYDYRDAPITPMLVSPLTFIGGSNGISATTSIPLPPGTQAGDLIVFTGAGTGGSTVSDPRMASLSQYVWTGTADGSGTPLAVNIAGTSGWALAVFRGGQVLDHQYVTGSGTSFPTSVFTDAITTISCIITNVGFGTTYSAVPTGYTEAEGNPVNGVNAHITYWASATDQPESSPAGSTDTGGGTYYTTLIKAG